MSKPELTIIQGRRVDVTAAAEFLVSVEHYQRIDAAAVAERWNQDRGSGRLDAHQPGGTLAEHERLRVEMLTHLADLIDCDTNALTYGL